MSRNRSLDEFAGAGEGADGERTDDDAEADLTSEGDVPTRASTAASSTTEPAGDPRGSEREATGGQDGEAASDREALDRPASTYVWSPGGGPCAACGTTVEERWRDGDDLVCAGCKEW